MLLKKLNYDVWKTTSSPSRIEYHAVEDRPYFEALVELVKHTNLPTDSESVSGNTVNIEGWDVDDWIRDFLQENVGCEIELPKAQTSLARICHGASLKELAKATSSEFDESSATTVWLYQGNLRTGQSRPQRGPLNPSELYSILRQPVSFLWLLPA
jgi:hypothetical protein